MKSRTLRLQIIISGITAIVALILLKLYPVTPRLEKGPAELWAHYYGFPVMMAALTILFLSLLTWFGMIKVTWRMKYKPVWAGVLILVAVVYVSIMSGFIGPGFLTPLYKLFSVDIHVFFALRDGVDSLAGIVGSSVYGAILYFFNCNQKRKETGGFIQ